MFKQLVKSGGIDVLMTTVLLCDINSGTHAEDNYLVGTYYYPWYHENDWFKRGLEIATDSLLHCEPYYWHFVIQQFQLLLNDSSPSEGEMKPYVNMMDTAGWRQDTVIVKIGASYRYWVDIAQEDNSIFVDSISWDLMNTYSDSLPDTLFSYWVSGLETGNLTREDVVGDILTLAEQYKWFITCQYWQLLGRGPNTHGLLNYTDKMIDGWTKDDIIIELCSSWEFWDNLEPSEVHTFVSGNGVSSLQVFDIQ